MPKMIGNTPDDLTPSADQVSAPRRGDVQLQWQQVRLLAGRLPIRAVLDTSDQGGPGVLAKRWYRWYVDARELLVLEGITDAMRTRGLTALDRAAEAEAREARAAAAGISVEELMHREARERYELEAYAERYPWAIALADAVAADEALSRCVRVHSVRRYDGLVPALTEALHDVGGSMTWIEATNGYCMPRTIEELRVRIMLGHDEVYH